MGPNGTIPPLDLDGKPGPLLGPRRNGTAHDYAVEPPRLALVAPRVAQEVPDPQVDAHRCDPGLVPMIRTQLDRRAHAPDAAPGFRARKRKARRTRATWWDRPRPTRATASETSSFSSSIRTSSCSTRLEATASCSTMARQGSRTASTTAMGWPSTRPVRSIQRSEPAACHERRCRGGLGARVSSAPGRSTNLLEPIGNIASAEFEAMYCANQGSPAMVVELN